MVGLFAKQVYSGAVTAKILEQFTNLTRRSFSQVVSDIITDRYKTALNKETEKKEEETSHIDTPEPLASEEECKIITTEEEKEGFLIVRAMLRKYIDINRVAQRDT